MGFVEREGLAMMVRDNRETDAIAPNFPVHDDNAVNLYTMVKGVELLYEEFRSKEAVFQYGLRTNEYRTREFASPDPHAFRK